MGPVDKWYMTSYQSAIVSIAYLVQFSIYLTLSNIVILKSRLRVTHHTNLCKKKPIFLCREPTSLKYIDPRLPISSDSVGLSTLTSTHPAAVRWCITVVQGNRNRYNWKPVCDFLLVFIVTILMPIFYRFLYITIYRSKISAFFTIFIPTVSFEAHRKGDSSGT